MPVRNVEIVQAFEEIADLLELADDNPFRIRAYRNAARELQVLGFDIARRLEKGEERPRSPASARTWRERSPEMARTGRLSFLEELRGRLPAGITELLTLPGVGTKRARVLYEKLKIGSAADPRSAAARGRLRELTGFGEKSEKKILETVGARLGERRFPLELAARHAEAYRHYLEAEGDRVAIAGSYRRKSPAVGDLDFLVVPKTPSRRSSASCAMAK